MPRLRVLAGPSVEQLEPITELVNTTTPYRFSSAVAEGALVVNIKGLTDPQGHVLTSDYFQREDRKGVTWSIQFQGRFLRSHYKDEPLSADDVMFGNIFDHPLKLPWGSSAAFKFMSYIDPNLTNDLASQTKPWALSPFIATMPYISHTRITKPGHTATPNNTKQNFDDKDSVNAESTAPPNFPPSASLIEDTAQLYKTVDVEKSLQPPRNTLWFATGPSSTGPSIPAFSSASERRAFFSDAAQRKKIVLSPEDVITSDFCYGFLEFTPSLSLVLPGGVSFDLMHYWDGQPVRFVCCERKPIDDGTSADAWGPIFWCVAIELVSEEGVATIVEPEEDTAGLSQDVD